MTPIVPVQVPEFSELRERCRLEWYLSEGSDPAQLVEDFLAEQGLPVRELAATSPARPGDASLPTRQPASRPGAAAGATLLVGAAAAARLIGAPPGKPSPAPAVPDLVVVVWEAGSRRNLARPGPRRPGPRRVGQWRVGQWRVGQWRESWTPRQHAAGVAAVRAAIARGDAYQVNLVGHAAATCQGDPLAALQRIAALPGARYPTVLQGEGWAIGCASPETLVAVAQGTVVTRPIKGTRPATGPGRTALRESAKERAEHVMIVDLVRNDLGQVARTGSVQVAELYAVRRWCDLWQAESVVSAAVADGVGLADLLRATCPGGSVTGAPKRAALALLAAIEPVGRGPSMGALGWVGHDGLDLGLTIRTVAVAGGQAHVWAGGGITWGSEPAAEVAEAAAKAAPLRAALAGS